MAAGTQSIFHGVVYHIDSRCDDYNLIRLLLKHNGGKEKSPHFTHPTRIIVDPQHFASFEPSKFSAYDIPRPIAVTPEWVYSSVKCGVKRPSQHYSADPALFFSSTVVSASGLSDTHNDFLRGNVMKYGGQWFPTLTDEVTHLIVDPTSDYDPGLFRPVLLSLDWVLESLAAEVLLPTAPYEFNPEPGRGIVSAARRFCEALSFPHELADNKPNNKPLIRSGGPLPLLPFEILSKIFVAYHEEFFDASLLVKMRVSQVCSYWRTVAHSTRELWTNLHLNFHCKKHYHCLRNVVEQWLARSHPRALSLTIRSCYPGAQNPIIQILLAHASRIHNLSLELPAAHFVPLFHAPTGSFPLLRNLTISIISIEDSIYDPESGFPRCEYFEEHFPDNCPDEEALWETMASPMTSLQDASRLQSIKIDGAAIHSLKLRVFPLAWGTLTDLDFASLTLTVRDTMRLLPQCIRLERLKLATEGSPNLILPLRPRARLPQLTEVHWSRFDDDGVYISDQLILPRLTILYLSEGSWEGVLRLYANSSFALRELSLDMHITFSLLSAFLREMPSLVSLILSWSLRTTDEFLAFLTYDEQHNAILPNLEKLDISHSESASAVLHMVESRWREDTACAV
ncbi:hypothetical protein MSAN_00356300 [Mycena sanguinolenta]|uniref:BRCT domain-containing protein n=1 Tax=Mycena sanguinolenta TaxID=230812 RepID=A0A8H7DKL6_9AGAR|nr:hypothetical protein MSAN_00356300 [Mycena sanguinolenta]